MDTITISHTPADGTVVDGDVRPHHPILKELGYRYSRNVGWYIRGSRDRRPRTDLIERAAEQLRAVGFEVVVEIDDGFRATAEREEARDDRAEARQDGLETKAEKKLGERDAAWSEADRMIKMMNGQPILIGHHSEKRHRKDIARTDQLGRKGLEAHREAENAVRRAEGSRQLQDQRASGPTTKRRIEKLEADVRKIDRTLAGSPCPLAGRRRKPEAPRTTEGKCPLCGREPVDMGDTVGVHYSNDWDKPASGEHLRRLTVQRERDVEEIEHWKKHLADIGFTMLSKADLKKGDRVRVRKHNDIGVVVRANPKTVTVQFAHVSWPMKYGYEEIEQIEEDASGETTGDNELCG